MPDKRTVDELSIEELERILAIKKREVRQKQLRRMRNNGRVVGVEPPTASVKSTPPAAKNATSDPTGLPAQTIDLPANAVQQRAITPQFEDDVEHRSYAKVKNSEDTHIWRRFIDRSLLLLEVAAVLGLVALGVVLFQNINLLERETAEAQSRADEQIRAGIPTIAPTPQLRLVDVVLPGGHTPPDPAGGGGQFNFEEIPEHLRAQFYEQVYLPPDVARAPVTDDTPRRIIIPDIDVDHVIVQGVDWEALKNGVGQLPNGITPKTPNGNLVLAAHNDIYGEIFRHLDQLEPGMEFQIQTATQIFTYRITGSDVVTPDAVHVMESRGYAAATLISCYPYRDNSKRIIIFAERVDTL